MNQAHPCAIPPVCPAGRKFETFSYLPAMDGERVRKQVEYILGQGWHAAIEHTPPEQAHDHYWSLWKLPFFGLREADRILAEAEACRDAHPDHAVRLVGYDSRRQTQGAALVIYRSSVAP